MTRTHFVTLEKLGKDSLARLQLSESRPMTIAIHSDKCDLQSTFRDLGP